MAGTRGARWLKGLFCVVLVLGIIAGGLFWAADRVPEFYREALDRPVTAEQQKQEAVELVQRTEILAEQVEKPGEWTQTFTESQINSWLATELVDKYGEELPEEISDPRVRIEADRLLVGFRYDGEDYQGIISLALEPKLTGPRQVTIDVLSLKAGAVPVPIKTVLEEVDPTLSDPDWNVELNAKGDGAEVIVQFLGDLAVEAQLTAISLDENGIRISGSTESDAANVLDSLELPLDRGDRADREAAPEN